MPEDVTRMTASVDCSMVGSGTVSTRTAWTPCQARAFIRSALPGPGGALPALEPHGEREHAHSREGQPDGDPHRRGQPEPRGEDDAAEPRAERVGDVERGVVERGPERLRVARDV